MPAASTATSAEIADALASHGATFLVDLAAATHRAPDEIERILWDGVARGLVMCDGFAAIRSKMRRDSAPPRPWRLSTLRRAASATASTAGRWSLVPAAEPNIDRHDLAEAVAEQLLGRWGVLFRDLALHDSLRLPWREIQWALRRLEDRGLVLGGRFVAGFSGEQYALPAAVEQLSRMRRLPRTHERLVVNASDPLNLVGVIVPGEKLPAIRTNRVVYVDGLPEDQAAAGRAAAEVTAPTRAIADAASSPAPAAFTSASGVGAVPD
jgi:ATP-dependent Lhr-like helicase